MRDGNARFVSDDCVWDGSSGPLFPTDSASPSAAASAELNLEEKEKKAEQLVQLELLIDPQTSGARTLHLVPSL